MGQAGLWQASDLGGLSVDLDCCRAFRAECLHPLEQLLWYASCLHPLEQPFFADSIVGALDIETDKANDPSAPPGGVDLLL